MKQHEIHDNMSSCHKDTKPQKKSNGPKNKLHFNSFNAKYKFITGFFLFILQIKYDPDILAKPQT